MQENSVTASTEILYLKEDTKINTALFNSVSLCFLSHQWLEQLCFSYTSREVRTAYVIISIIDVITGFPFNIHKTSLTANLPSKGSPYLGCVYKPPVHFWGLPASSWVLLFFYPITHWCESYAHQWSHVRWSTCYPPGLYIHLLF